MRNVLSRGRFSYVVSAAGMSPLEVPASSEPPAPPAQTLSRRQRRTNEVLNRRLKRRLEKDGTPVNVEVLPDGGIHVTVKKEEA